MSPTAKGYQLEMIVHKFLEDLPQPVHSTVIGIPLRHNDNFLDRPKGLGTAHLAPADGSNWINIGRDTQLEQEMLFHIQERITNK